MHTKTTLALLAAFALGCVATRAFVVPPAHAQSAQRWEYFCFEESGAEDVTTKANAAGDQGWELATNDSTDNTWCFKRAR